jgi:L-asparaginase II
VEGRHYGRLLITGSDGAPIVRVGDTGAPIFPRSANKPLQAVGMLQAGLGELTEGDPQLVAIAASSHSGQPEHLAAVRSLLARAGLTEQDLANTPGLPLDEASAHEWLRAGGSADSLHQNCSGKHAAMLATCVAAGWPTADYLDPGHQLQVALRVSVGELAGEPVAAVGVDGCGAPLFALSLGGLATAFRKLVTAPASSPARLVADAMRANPYLVGGAGRAVTLMMQDLPGCLVKDGAEGVIAAALPDGSTVTVKIEDGAARAAVPVAVAGLRRLLGDPNVLDRLASTPVYGHGRVVGEVRASLGEVRASPG